MKFPLNHVTGWILLLAMLLANPSVVRAQTGPARGDPLTVLREHGVEPTEPALSKFLRAVARGEHGPLADVEADSLIAQLGAATFRVREKAARTLETMPLPPVGRLEAAISNRDPEVARRARLILDHLTTRLDPIVAVLQVARDRKITLVPADLAGILRRCQTPPALDAIEDALIAAVKPEDLTKVRQWLTDRNPRLKAAAIRAFGQLQKEAATAELRRFLEDPEERVRAAAARALVEGGQPLDWKKYASLVTGDARVLVYRAAEKRFRQENRQQRKDPKVLQQYEELLLPYSDALATAKQVKREVKSAGNTQYWFNLGLDTSKHPEVLMYRIRWSSGQWSYWFVPGFNDKEVSDRPVRWWGCFNDHEYEVITTTDKAKHREIDDLP